MASCFKFLHSLPFLQTLSDEDYKSFTNNGKLTIVTQGKNKNNSW
jgi:hypothetical protein